MDSDIPLLPDTGWGTEVRDLMRERGQRFCEAFDFVTLRYLAQGDFRPITDLLWRSRIEPTETFLRYLAAMSKDDGETCFRLGFEVVRPPGRPQHSDSDTAHVKDNTALMAGFMAMSEGRKPGWPFWRLLLAALGNGDPVNFPNLRA
jgi:hypothetical protein